MKIIKYFSSKIKNKINFYIEKIEFNVFASLLKKYKVDFYYKDQLGILTKREFGDNFQYIFKTKNSCDAVPLMLALSGRIKNSNISIDIGANIGITAIWMAKNSNKVYAFEPEKNNLKRLKDNLKVNGIDNVEIVEKAVSDRDTVGVLNIFESYGHHSLSANHISSPINTQQVDIISLEKFCNLNNISEIDFLKIDVEGFELEVLMGAKNLLNNKKIKVIAFEHSKVLLEEQKRPLDSVIKLLINNGYEVFDLNNNKVEIDKIKYLVQQDLYAI